MNAKRSSAWAWLGWVLLLAVVVVAVMAAVGAMTAVQHLPADLVVTVDGERLDLPVTGAEAWWVGLAAAAVAVVVTLVVVPLALVFGVGLPLLVGAGAALGALLVAGLAVAVVGSPVILLAVLIWWAVRRRPRAEAAREAGPGDTTHARALAVPRVGEHTDNLTPLA